MGEDSSLSDYHGTRSCVIRSRFQFTLDAVPHGGSQSVASEPQRGVL